MLRPAMAVRAPPQPPRPEKFPLVFRRRPHVFGPDTASAQRHGNHRSAGLEGQPRREFRPRGESYSQRRGLRVPRYKVLKTAIFSMRSQPDHTLWKASFHYRTFIQTPAIFGVDCFVACESVMVPYLKKKQHPTIPNFTTFWLKRLRHLQPQKGIVPMANARKILIVDDDTRSAAITLVEQ